MKRIVPSKHCKECGRREGGHYGIACNSCQYRYTSEYHKSGVFYEYRGELLTIEEWADYAGVCKGTMYRYFKIYKDVGKCLSALRVRQFVDSKLDRKESS